MILKPKNVRGKIINKFKAIKNNPDWRRDYF
jgi:hypothetical protein